MKARVSVFMEIPDIIGDEHWLEWIIPCPSKFLKSQIRTAARRLGERR